MSPQKNNVQIKNIAEKAGVSIGTVSIVLNGRGDELRISKGTQERVLSIASKLNYTPNIHARRLRMSESSESSYLIALFWNMDYMKNEMLSNFIRCIHLSSTEKNINIELAVQPYEPGGLQKFKEKFNTSRYSGIIIANASDDDVSFLKANDFRIPIVVINRETGKYCNVSINDYEAGKKCAKLFSDGDHQKVGIIGIKKASLAARLKAMGFKDGCTENSLEIHDEWILEDPRNNFKAGYEMAKRLFDRKEHPTAVLIMYDYLTLGVVEACKELNYKIPEDISIIVYGHSEFFDFYSPRISYFYVTNEELAESALSLLLLIMKHDVNSVINRNLSPHFFIRESCRQK